MFNCAANMSTANTEISSQVTRFLRDSERKLLNLCNSTIGLPFKPPHPGLQKEIVQSGSDRLCLWNSYPLEHPQWPPNGLLQALRAGIDFDAGFDHQDATCEMR